ncbi:MAG: CotH kinase family protein, partial [Kiritimatiellae bacterium]|nr:CotH kinase family protein [Kiritimatiellia bacterium]
PEQSDTAYKRILLRNSGNDWSATGLRDAMMQRLFRPLARTDTQDYSPAVVYVNGEYWGVQNIREHYSRYLLERKYGVDPDTLDLVKAIAGSEAMEIDEGDDADYKEVLAYVKANDLSQAEHFDWVERRMDLENLIDHYACEIYCCNTDWPGNNLGLWRLRTAFAPNAPYGHDGRWRWLMYDTDHGFGQSSSVNTDMMTQARRSSRGVCQPHFDRLLANTDFRARFLNRFTDLLNTAFVPARVHRIIDETAALVESEMPRHIARWGRMGSFAIWQTRINSLKTFASGRPAPALTNLVNEFGLGGTARLTVALSNGMGRVTVNTVTIDAATPGLADPAAPYPWHGVYFRTVPITLTAQADPGFTFSHWETADGNRTDPTLAVTLTGDATCRAVFEAGVQPRVTVNELLADATPAGGILHPADGAAADWFELFNEGPAPVALGGYWLEDSQPANAWRIPEGVVVQPGGCLTVWASSVHASGINADGSLTVPFGLGKDGDAIALLVPDRSRELDRVVFGKQNADISQGRWPNGVSGTWNGFTRPTPGLPNRNPAFSAGLLPGLPAQTVQADTPLTVSCVTTAAVSSAVYAVAEGPASAAIDSAGLFTWTPPSDLGSGVYAFRITLMGLLGGLPVTDETTLLVSVRAFSHARIDVAAEPAGGGTVAGGGLYAVGTQITLSPEAAPLWRFARWSDGLTAPARQVTVQRDVTYTALFAYGLNVPERVSGTVSDGLPLLYWPPVADAEGYVVRRAASRAGPFTVIGMPAANVFRDAAPLVGIDAVYTVSARHGGSESEKSQALPVCAGGVTRKLTGGVIGTLGAYGNNPSRTREMAFDGNLSTFYDAAADGGWPGLDLGSERWWRLARLRYAPRVEFPGRMVNGAFEVTRFSDGVTTFEAPLVLHTVDTVPPINQYTEVPLSQDLNIRYLRYRPPPGGWGNIAELEVYGHETVPPAPAGLSAAAEGTNMVSLTWSGAAHCQGYLVMRAQGAGSPFAPVAFSEATSLLDTGLAAGTGYRYCVAAVNGSSLSAGSLPVTATTATLPPAAPRFAAPQSGAAVTVGGGEAAIYLSGALDPRLELVCSADLSTPVETWQPVAGATFAPPDPETGAVRVTVTTTAPRLFFAVRLRP